MATHELYTKLRKYSQYLFTKHGRSNDLPKTIIGAEHGKQKAVAHSGPVPDPLAPKLKNKLLKIGDLGKLGMGGNYIGCCCEVRSSNQIIGNNLDIPIKNIQFTDAIRPRNGQIIKRCLNCKAVFG